MKLLSPIETRDKRESQNLALSSKSASLDEAIVAKHNELLSLDEEFLRVINKQRLERLEEDREWTERNSELRKEVDSLERRRNIALVPLEEREKEIQTREEVLLQREQEVVSGEERVSEMQDLLETRLDEASERLGSVSSEEKALARKKSGIEMQAQETVKRTDKLNDVLEESFSVLEKANKNIATQRAELSGRETILSEKEARLTKKEEDLSSRERALTDRYATLERAVKEATKNYNLKNVKQTTARDTS